MSSNIPLRSFDGILKQIWIEKLDDNERYALDLVFPWFRVLDERFSFRRWKPVWSGLNSKVFYVGRGRERRFAGDKSLTRQRYFSLCSPEGDDSGTLLSELKAYAGFSARLPFDIFDSTFGDGAEEEMLRFGHESAQYPHILLRVGPKEPNPLVDELHLGSAATIHFNLPILIAALQLENVLDLRWPDCQEWFFENFRGLEQEYKTVVERDSKVFIVKFDAIDSPHDFSAMIPVLLAPDLGGGHPFIQGVGAWLRSNRVNALIYPSARADWAISGKERELRDSKGWNIVIYAGSPATDWSIHFGRTVSWQPYLGEQFRLEWTSGVDDSWYAAATGLAERNERRFRRTQQLAETGGELGLFDLASGCFSLLEIDTTEKKASDSE